jgi:hypothetical protein
VDSVLDVRDQWLCIGEHMRNSQSAKHDLEIPDRGVSHAAYYKRLVLSNGRTQGSWLLLSRSAAASSFTDDDQSTCRFIVIWESRKIRINITSKSTVWFKHTSEFFYKCSSPSGMRDIRFPNRPHTPILLHILQQWSEQLICNLQPSFEESNDVIVLLRHLQRFLVILANLLHLLF